MNKIPPIGIVIVAHNNPLELRVLLTSVKEQVRRGDFVVVIDNHSEYLSAQVARKYEIVNKVIESKNEGFALGCNKASALIPKKISTFLFLNPDTQLKNNALDLLRDSPGNKWDAWMGLLTMKGNKINSAGNIVHMSGLSWCDSFNKPVSYANVDKYVNVLSGACLAVRRSVFEELGGIDDSYFLYFEDTDFSAQLMLRGKKMGLVSDAHIFHNYDYSKSKNKWFYIEKNRFVYILRCWPIAVILVLLPYLLVCEVGLWIVSIAEKRFLLRITSIFSFIKSIPRNLKGRRGVQNKRVISSYQFMQTIVSTINTEQLGNTEKFAIINILSTWYYKLGLLLLKPFSKSL